jgi:hypothetical protein
MENSLFPDLCVENPALRIGSLHIPVDVPLTFALCCSGSALSKQFLRCSWKC